VVWTDFRNSNGNIFAAYRPAGGAWGTNAKINDDLGTAEQIMPRLAVSSTGNAHAAWVDFRYNTGGDIYYAYRPAGGSWSSNIKINNDAQPGKSHSYPAISVDPQGNARIIWCDNRGGDFDIYSAYRSKEGVWAANEMVNHDQSAGDQGYPAIGLDPYGNAFALWQNGIDATKSSDIYAASRTAGGTWGPAIKLNSPATNPNIFVDNLIGTYAAYGLISPFNLSSYYHLYLSFLPRGGSVSNPIAVGISTLSPSHPPRIAVDSAGNVHLLWTDNRFGLTSIFHCYAPRNRLSLPVIINSFQ
jgi:hypothetical protein